MADAERGGGVAFVGVDVGVVAAVVAGLDRERRSDSFNVMSEEARAWQKGADRGYSKAATRIRGPKAKKKTKRG